MNSVLIAVITYIFSTIFAIAGMGAAGVLIPNYVTLGMVMYSAILAGLLQNAAALSVATFNNIRNHNVDLKLGITILLPAIIMVPIGVYANISIPKILDFIVFASFLLFALYRLFSMNEKTSEIKGKKGNLLAIAFGIIAGYIGGLIGIDGSPFAIIAISYIILDTKKDLRHNRSCGIFNFIDRVVLLPIFPSY